MCKVVPTPVFHAAAAPSTHFSTLKSGYITYIMRRFDLNEFLDAIEKYNITDLMMVPPIAVGILMSPHARTRPFLKKSSLQAAVLHRWAATSRANSTSSWTKMPL